MKNWLKKKLRQWLCEHKNADLVDQVQTTYKSYPKNDPTQDPNVMVSELLYLKKRFDCNVCGKKGIIIEYKQ